MLADLHDALISPLAVITTVLVTPLIVLVLWVGYIALLAGVFVPAATDWSSGLLAVLAECAVRSVQLFDAIPGSAVRVREDA